MLSLHVNDGICVYFQISLSLFTTLRKKERVKREESKWPRGELVAVSGDLKRFPASSGGGEGAAS